MEGYKHQNKAERQIKMIYGFWKKKAKDKMCSICPDEESLALFIEGKLSDKEQAQIKRHLISCHNCSQIVLINSKIYSQEDIKAVPEVLKDWAKDLVSEGYGNNILNIILRLKEKTQELLQTTGNVLWDNKPTPLVLLRSKDIGETDEDIKIVKDFDNIKAEVNIERVDKGSINVAVIFCNIKTGRPIDNLRVTLIKGNLELESYISGDGRANFRGIGLGKYILRISRIGHDIGMINLEIKDK